MLMTFDQPVLLVHGMWDDGAVFQDMSAYLKQQGWPVYTIDLIPSNGDRPLDHLAEQLADYVDRALPGKDPFNLVGFSMGGIVSRYFVQQLGGIQRVERLVTIASPHQGTWLAYSSQRPGCVQMRPNSPFLAALNQEISLLEQINFTSIWTPLDAMIVPSVSSNLSVGKNICLWVPTHAQMITDSKCLKVVNQLLVEPRRVALRS